MRRIVIVLTILGMSVAACSDDGGLLSTSASTAPAATTGTTEAGTTGATTTTAPTTTLATTTTTAPTTTTTLPPEATPVDHNAYCVRGTAPDDALNVRSGPGLGSEVVGELAWNAAEVPAGGFSAPDPQGRPWFLVGYEGGRGWAAGWYLEPAPCTGATIAVAPFAGPEWPEALAGSLVPWAWVDADWALALYTPDWGERLALYLLSPQGVAFEVFSWTDPEPTPFDLFDWRPDGKAALVGFHFAFSDQWETRLLDLEARTAESVITGTLGFDGPASFTRPDGHDLVYRIGDGLTERIEVHRPDGSLFSTLLNHPRPADWNRQVGWLYGLEGTSVVVGDGTALRLLANNGEPILDFDAPGVGCRPLAWWDQATILTRCVAPEVLAYLPTSDYGRLWLVPADGSSAAALTALPAEPASIGDYGFSDAWRLDDRVFATWAGDCGAGSVDLVQPDGTTETLSPPDSSNRLVGVVGAALLVQRWTSCDGSPGSLHLVAPDGSELATLLAPPTNDTWGVIDALVRRDLP